MKFIIQEGNKVNANNRLYPPELLEREAIRWNTEYVKNKKAFLYKSTSDPDRGVGEKDIIGEIHNFTMENNNLVIEATMVDINDAVKLWPLLENYSMSCRMSGRGSLTKQSDGTYIVNSDYELDNIIITNTPA